MHVLVAEDDYYQENWLKLTLRNWDILSMLVKMARGMGEFDRSPVRSCKWLAHADDGWSWTVRNSFTPKYWLHLFHIIDGKCERYQKYHEAMDRGVTLTKPLDVTASNTITRSRAYRKTRHWSSRSKILLRYVRIQKFETSDEDWVTIEEFMVNHLGLKPSHGIHPKYYEDVIRPQMKKLREKNKLRSILWCIIWHT